MKIATPILILCVPSIAAADSKARVHDGFYFRFGAGPGYAIGREVVDGTSASGGGIDVSSELAFGTTVRPGLVVGGGTFPMVVPAPSYGDADSGGHHLSATGPFVDHYVDPQRGLHVQGAIVFTAGYKEAEGNLGSAIGFGFGASAGVGYDTWIGDQWSVGPLFRLTYYRWSASTDAGTDYDLDLVSPSLLVALTYH